LDRRVSRLAADGRCFWQERLSKKRHRPKRGGIAAQRRQADNDRPQRRLRLFREIFYFANPGGSGLQINDQAAMQIPSPASGYFSAPTAAIPKGHKVVTDRKRMMLRTAGETS
jgi:hypothetical protein